jgi:hypothetical protein
MFNNAKTIEIESSMNDVINIITQEGLPKEKEQMCQFANAWDKELSDGVIRSVEDCFEATFKTKKK